MAESDIIVNALTLLLGWLVLLPAPRLFRSSEWFSWLESRSAWFAAIAAKVSSAPPVTVVKTAAVALCREDSVILPIARVVYLIAGVHVVLMLLTALRAYRSLRRQLADQISSFVERDDEPSDASKTIEAIRRTESAISVQSHGAQKPTPPPAVRSPPASGLCAIFDSCCGRLPEDFEPVMPAARKLSRDSRSSRRGSRLSSLSRILSGFSDRYSSLAIALGGDLPARPLPPPGTWASPLFTRMVLKDQASAHLYQLPQSPMPWNGPFAVQNFETPFFQGRVLLRGRGLPLEEHAASYFGNRRRVQQVVFQGQFKADFCLDELWGGQIFDKPWARISRHILVPGMKAAKLLNPSMICDLTAEKPHFLFPLIAAQQHVNVSLKGKEPDILGDIPEDCRLLATDFQLDDETEHVRVSFRKKHLSRLSNLGRYRVSRDHVYTLEHYQDMLHFNSFEYRIPIVNWSVKLSDYLRDMPLEIAALRFKPQAGKPISEELVRQADTVDYLWRVQVFHRACIE